MTALVPLKWRFSTKKTHVWSASLFQGMAGPEQDLIRGHGPEQHLIHRQDPEGQRRSALTEIPQFGGLGRTGGRRFGAGRVTRISRAVSPHTGRRRSSWDSLWGASTAAPALGAPRGDPRPLQAAPGGTLQGAGTRNPNSETRDSPKPGEPRPEATPGRAASAGRGNAAGNRHGSRRLFPHGGATWYLPPPPTPSSGFTPPPHPRGGRGLALPASPPLHPYS